MRNVFPGIYGAYNLTRLGVGATSDDPLAANISARFARQFYSLLPMMVVVLRWRPHPRERHLIMRPDDALGEEDKPRFADTEVDCVLKEQIFKK